MRRSPICQSPMPVRRLGSRSSSMYRPECRTNGVLRGPNRIRFPLLVGADALVDAPEQSKRAFARIRIDTYVGMGFSSLVALAIMVTTAATLHVAGTVDIQTSSQAAEALKPVAGRFAFTIFALGIIGTGLLAIPVLAGSAAYAPGEARRWPIGLARQPIEAKAFYATIALATLVGTAVDFSPIDPIKALYWSAVINGIVSCPVMVTMMLMTRRTDIMGTNTVGGPLQWIGGWRRL